MSYLLNGMEHRWGERVRVNIPVQVAVQALTRIDGRLKNLSLSGALMKADGDLRLHSLIGVCIKSTQPSQRDAVIEAHVTRKLKDDIGVEWCEVVSPDCYTWPRI